MADDLMAHHRRATSNQMSDTHLGQTRLQPRHDRRAILDTEHPTTTHGQPPNSITAKRDQATPLWHCHPSRNFLVYSPNAKHLTVSL